jgi:glutamate synthase (NADPH/NADH) small chain
MGAGRKAARSMKAYLGIRDAGLRYRDESRETGGTLFGIDTRERNFVRVRVAAAGQRQEAER